MEQRTLFDDNGEFVEEPTPAIEVSTDAKEDDKLIFNNISGEVRHLGQILESMAELDEEIMKSDGEITPAVEALLSQDENDLTRKIDGYGAIIHEYEGKLAVIDAEIKRLGKLKSLYDNTRKGIVNLLDYQMKRFGITELRGKTTRVSYRASSSVEFDFEKLVADYEKDITKLRTMMPAYLVVDVSVSKKNLGAVLKTEPKTLPEGGAVLVKSKNIQVC